VLCAGPLLAYSAPYRANQRLLGTRAASEISTWSATPSSFVAAPYDNRLYGWTYKYGGPEGHLWPGAIAIALGVAGIWTARRRSITWMYGAALLLSALLALGTNAPVYRLALLVVPPLRGLRAPARFGMVFAMAVAVLAGLGAAWLLSRLPRSRWRHLAGAAVLAGVVAEYASDVGPLHAWVQRVPIYARWLAQQPAGAVVDLPIARADRLPQHEAEWSFYGRSHHHPMVNGYSGYYPKPYIELLGEMVAFPRGRSVEALRERDVRYIVLHETHYDAADFLEFESRVRGTPGLRFVGRFPDPDYPVSIFELVNREQ
jgi:hypothetical protein